MPSTRDECFDLDAVGLEASLLGTTEIGLAAGLDTSKVWIGDWSSAGLVPTVLSLLDLGQ